MRGPLAALLLHPIKKPTRGKASRAFIKSTSSPGRAALVPPPPTVRPGFAKAP